MSISQKAIFCYIHPKKISAQDDLLHVNKCTKRFSQPINMLKQIPEEGEHMDEKEGVLRKWVTQKFIDDAYNKEGKLTIVINRVEKMNIQESQTSICWEYD